MASHSGKVITGLRSDDDTIFDPIRSSSLFYSFCVANQVILMAASLTNDIRDAGAGFTELSPIQEAGLPGQAKGCFL
jgi:hypothetical protein